ncbi:hypothetical protein DDE19_21615 [Micromonospora ureilytica]|uniref:Uncharacterized protein n=2 Tax=Micromonospora ureilytica TaxID=709868 RepID=A0A3N9XPF1_9ACTN|nr:hypothetical protein DDE19_21615 [Micromonospora ureilytica]
MRRLRHRRAGHLRHPRREDQGPGQRRGRPAGDPPGVLLRAGWSAPGHSAARRVPGFAYLLVPVRDDGPRSARRVRLGRTADRQLRRRTRRCPPHDDPVGGWARCRRFRSTVTVGCWPERTRATSFTSTGTPRSPAGTTSFWSTTLRIRLTAETTGCGTRRSWPLFSVSPSGPSNGADDGAREARGDMSWVDLVTNPQGLREIFSEGPPTLSGVSLHGLVVEREGPTLRLRLDLPGYPANPPAKWRRNGSNTVQVELLFGGVSELRLVGISTEVIADIDVRPGVSLEVRSASMVVSALAASVTVSEVVAYVDGGRWAGS